MGRLTLFNSLRATLLTATAIAFVATGSSTGKHVPARTSVHNVAWFNSMSDALTEAKQKKKPILLLSMFGKLDEDMPCANARTLRATLFADPEFKKLVTEDVIPAWEMVRPVPHVYIDLGEGKKLVRTVRGNAVMYLCNPDGKVIDAYPGIYTAGDFLPMVRESISQLANADSKTVLEYHRARGKMPPLSFTTLSKGIVESPTLAMIGAPKITGVQASTNFSDPVRGKFLMAASRIQDLSLTPLRSEEVIQVATGQNLSPEKRELLKKQVLANDSNTNMVRVRPVVHLYMATLTKLPTTAEARDAILETILKIPYKDPYFGLKDLLLPGTDN